MLRFIVVAVTLDFVWGKSIKQLYHWHQINNFEYDVFKIPFVVELRNISGRSWQHVPPSCLVGQRQQTEEPCKYQHTDFKAFY